MTQQRTHGDAAGPSLTFIGRIETPYETQSDCPYNVNPGGPECRIVLDPPYAAGLTGLAVGERILVLYWLDRAKRGQPRVGVRRSGKVGGAFAARTPNRPNPIGAAVVTIQALEGPVVTVRGLDCVNGTPLLDLKPALRAEAPTGGSGV
jgi:tRNA-Thr(GGU) m(6)t(6)A37 methyltransferase TsaA